MIQTHRRRNSHFTSETGSFLKRAGLVTASALVALAVVLAASASADPSPPNPAASRDSPASAADVM